MVIPGILTFRSSPVLVPFQWSVCLTWHGERVIDATPSTMSDHRSASASPRRIPRPASTSRKSMSQVAGAACTIRSTWEGASASPFRFGPLGGLEAVAGVVEIKPYSTAHEQALETNQAPLGTRSDERRGA